MNLHLQPGQPLRGEFSPPGDKSLSHRAALLAALAQGESRIENYLVAGVTHAMLEALTALGVAWELHGATLTVTGRGLAGLQTPAHPLDCGNSATTLRLLAGALVAANLPVTLDGSPGLRRRPMGRIVEPLQQMGAAIQSTAGKAPLYIRRLQGPIRAIEYRLPVASAQLKSCLLLAGLAARGSTVLHEPGPSRDHTERLLASMGFHIQRRRASLDTGGAEWYTTRLEPPGALSIPALNLNLPGDISAAAFLIVAALITPGSEITLRRVGLNPTRTGLLEALESMGGAIRICNRSESGGEPLGDIQVGASQLHGAQVDGALVVRMIDEFPAFAVAAAFARGATQVSGAGELRLKESDRISALCAELRSLGVALQEAPDGFTIQGDRPPAGGTVDPHGDHRLAMSLAVAGLASRAPLQVRNADILAESFPGFVAALRALGAQVNESA